MAFLTPPLALENSSAHNAADYRTMVASAVGRGRSGVCGAGELKVTEKSGTPDMSVDVAAGGIFVASTRDDDEGTYHAYNDATINVAISAADPTNPRIDRILVQVRDEEQDAALTQNDARILVVEGTPAASPAAPAITVEDYVELAQVTVPALASSITNSDIDDLRVAHDSWARGRGVLAQVVSASGLLPGSSGSAERLTALDLNDVVVGAGRLLKVSHSARVGITGTGPIDLFVELRRDATILRAIETSSIETNGARENAGFVIDQPGAGTYDFSVWMSQTGTVTKRWRGDITPGTFVVEDVGGVLL